MKKVYIIIFLAAIISLPNCYTAFKHPQVTSNSQYLAHEDIQIGDNCMDCHQSNVYTTPVLPSSATNDGNWQFYSNSSWWQDEMTLDERRSFDNYIAPTGPRLRGESSSHSNSAVIQSAPPGPSLGKVIGENVEEPKNKKEQDDRRSFQRRKETQKDTKTRSSKREPEQK